ncbi:MAG: class II fructose-bisphosphate aldolase [Nitrospirae bacterium]|nr:class II fructose-bisphosphate aldolase [Nitrospirota bacterium]MCL5285833.1 class II fructose-bisphosphate aldolase [Nitrospirota bacterium]
MTQENVNDWQKKYRYVAEFSGGGPEATDLPRLRKDYLDSLVEDLVFHPDAVVRGQAFRLIRSAFSKSGATLASIEPLYRAIGRGEAGGFTVPAINIRGLTYLTVRRVLRAMRAIDGGPVLFELAKSEIGYSFQRPMEYAGLVMAGALAEGHTGPIFVQGDHYQFNARNYARDPAGEIESLKKLIQESIDAGYRNIDIDASTLVTLDPPDLRDQQRENGKMTALLTHFIRQITPDGTRFPVSVGGEIGEVGKENSSPEELDAFMEVYSEEQARLDARDVPISKISVQTGTSHGGVPLPDGRIAPVKLDFDTLEALGERARTRYNMGGAVQHGASTLPEDLFDHFPRVRTLEIHLATGFQNAVFDHPAFPPSLKKEMESFMTKEFAGERKAGETEEQFFYKNRKRTYGPFKKELASLPEKVLDPIMGDLEKRFVTLFKKLGLSGTSGILTKYF